MSQDKEPGFYIEYMRLDQIRRDPENAKEHDLGALGEAFRRFGYVMPMVLNETTGMLLAGHGRLDQLEALRLAGEPAPERIQVHGPDRMWMVPVIRGIRLSPDDGKAYTVADNRLVELGGWHEPLLAQRLIEIGGPDSAGLRGTGFDAEDVEALVNAVVGEAARVEVPEPQVDHAEELAQEWRVEQGQLWRLPSRTPGHEHRLVCGDSTDASVVRLVMAGEDAETLIFDPEWDAMPPAMMGFPSILAFCDGGTLKRVTERYGNPTWLFVWDCVSSWYTPNRPLRRAKFCCWYGEIDRYDFDGWHYGDAGESRVVWNTRGKYEFTPDPRGKHLSDVFQSPITKLHAESEHSHSKPADWVTLLIGNCTSGIVFDPFLGSGISIVACENLGRQCRAIEISPGYVGVALQLYQDTFGIRAFVTSETMIEGNLTRDVR